MSREVGGAGLMPSEAIHRERAVLTFLAKCGRCSTRRLTQTTGASTGTFMALAQRGYIEPHLQASYRITESGRARAEELA